MKILIFGLWHQGIVAAACFAKWGHTTVAIDSDLNLLSSLKKGVSPIYEPGLNELLSDGIKNKKLVFDSESAAHLKNCDYILFAHDTPVDDQDESDLTNVYTDLHKISEALPTLSLIHI